MNDDHKQLWVILLIVFIGLVGTSIAYPIFPPLFLHPEHGSIVPSSWDNNAKSIFLGLALAVYPLGQFIGSPILGGISDYYGRKPVLVWSLAGCAAGYLLTALSLRYSSLWLLLVSRFITGMMEGNLAIVRAMGADLHSISKYKTIGRINSACAIGYVMGPLIGGLMADNTIVPWFSFAVPFYASSLISLLAVILSITLLSASRNEKPQDHVTILENFNLFAKLSKLFKRSVNLKYLLITSTVFTFAVDIFYEFGPVYLTGMWNMKPAGIAVYNAALSLMLACSAAWLPTFFSRYYNLRNVIIAAMSISGIFLAALTIYPTMITAFVLFALLGLSIATVTTNMTIQISGEAGKLIQGEALGAQLGMRMLGDAVLCMAGGFMIMSSVMMPIILSSLIAFTAAVIYMRRF
jgi:MFS family permease